jgi:hypothetical protein
MIIESIKALSNFKQTTCHDGKTALKARTVLQGMFGTAEQVGLV